MKLFPMTLLVLLVIIALGGCSPALLRDPRTSQVVNCGSVLEKGVLVRQRCIEGYERAGFERVGELPKIPDLAR